MSSSNYPLRNSGIYRNLPTFDSSLKNLKALICGGSGISGFHALRALLDTPERWSHVYVLSRSGLPESMEALLTQEQRDRIQYVSIDLQTSSDDIATKLKEAQVQPDYIFFYSYMNPKTKNAMDPSASKEIYELNAPLLGNLLEALPQASIKPKRVLLQTGGKHYGGHIGRSRNPVMESDPAPKHLQPDQFYYAQERQLFDFCSKHPETDWNVVRPGGIVGAVNKTWLNSFYPFGVYAAVQAHKGEPLEFGGDFESWQYPFAFSTARMTGYLSEWAVLEGSTANQDFNAVDGSMLCWDRFFHDLAGWYGVGEGIVLPKSDEERSFDKTVTLAGGKDAPLGYGPPLKCPYEFRLGDWAKKAENHKAWNEIMSKNPKVDFDPFASEEDVANTFMGDFCYIRLGVMSQEKARSYGFSGFVNTTEAVFEMFEECEKMGMLPRMTKREAKDGCK